MEQDKVQNTTQVPREQRLELIRAIQEARDSHVIAYVVGDRQGAVGQ